MSGKATTEEVVPEYSLNGRGIRWRGMMFSAEKTAKVQNHNEAEYTEESLGISDG